MRSLATQTILGHNELLPFLELSLKNGPAVTALAQTLQTQAQCHCEGANPQPPAPGEELSSLGFGLKDKVHSSSCSQAGEEKKQFSEETGKIPNWEGFAVPTPLRAVCF